jgi:hypothetical protein
MTKRSDERNGKPPETPALQWLSALWGRCHAISTGMYFYLLGLSLANLISVVLYILTSLPDMNMTWTSSRYVRIVYGITDL